MSNKQTDHFNETVADMEEIIEDCDHECTSSCQKDTDCPCVNSHSHKEKLINMKKNHDKAFEAVKTKHMKRIKNIYAMVLIAMQKGDFDISDIAAVYAMGYERCLNDITEEKK